VKALRRVPKPSSEQVVAILYFSGLALFAVTALIRWRPGILAGSAVSLFVMSKAVDLVIQARRLASRRPTLQVPVAPAPLRRTLLLMDVIGAVLPARIVNEQIGDAREQMHKFMLEGRPPWLICLRGVSAVCWAVVNTLLDVVSRARL